MALSWTAVGVLETERQFRRVIGYRLIWGGVLSRGVREFPACEGFRVRVRGSGERAGRLVRRAVRRPPRLVVSSAGLGVHDREAPAPPREFPADGDYRDGGALVAGIERFPAAVKPAVGGLGAFAYLGGLGFSSAQSSRLGRYGLRWCHAASTRSRRA